MRVKVRTAYKYLQEIKRDDAAMRELPIAQLATLTANINRDSKKGKPFNIHDFTLFHERDLTEGFPADAAMVAVALRRERKLPDVLIGVWPQLINAAKEGHKMPEVRALVSDDLTVGLLAPKPNGKDWSGLLAVSQHPPDGWVVLRDIDRPLLTYRLRLARSEHAAYVSDHETLLAS